jgi:hypothetical protein
VIVIQANLELRAGQAFCYRALQFDLVFTFFRQKPLLSWPQDLALSRLTLSLPAPRPANSALFLDAPHLTRGNVPPLAPCITQDALLHHFLAKALQQAILRLSIS